MKISGCRPRNGTGEGAWNGDCANVLQAPNGGPVRADSSGVACGCRQRRRLGLEGLGLHDLRHAATVWMFDAGVPLEVASGRLGHSTIRTTSDVYGRLSEPADRKAAAALGDLFGSDHFSGQTPDKLAAAGA